MRRFFIFVFMVYAASACAQSNHSMQQDSTDTFVVTHDTVRIDAKAFTDPLSTLSLRKAVKLHGFYYVLLSEVSVSDPSRTHQPYRQQLLSDDCRQYSQVGKPHGWHSLR